MIGSNVLKVQRQQSLRLSLTVRDPETNVPLNLTGATFSVVDNTLPFTPAFAITNAASGIATMTATQPQMAGLATEKQYSLKIKLVDTGGNDYVFPAMILEVQG